MDMNNKEQKEKFRIGMENILMPLWSNQIRDIAEVYGMVGNNRFPKIEEESEDIKFRKFPDLISDKYCVTIQQEWLDDSLAGTEFYYDKIRNYFLKKTRERIIESISVGLNDSQCEKIIFPQKSKVSKNHKRRLGIIANDYIGKYNHLYNKGYVSTPILGTPLGKDECSDLHRILGCKIQFVKLDKSVLHNQKNNSGKVFFWRKGFLEVSDFPEQIKVFFDKSSLCVTMEKRFSVYPCNLSKFAEFSYQKYDNYIQAEFVSIEDESDYDRSCNLALSRREIEEIIHQKHRKHILSLDKYYIY